MTGRPPGPEPLDSNYPELNASFYAGAPWEYFRHRLVHLAAVASDTSQPPLTGPFAVGPVRLGMESRKVDRYPSPGQTFVAIECEVLLHHAAETLLRLVYAHAEPSRCPWLRMSALFSAKVFKKWVKKLVRDPDLDNLAADVFGSSDAHPEGPAQEAKWIRVFGWHFLSADCYNAAKHGMAVGGGSEERVVTVGDDEIFRRRGAALSWLANWPREGNERPRRWTQASRLFSIEAYLLMIETAALLMEAIYIRGRALHLDADEPIPDADYGVMPPPRSVFETLDIPSHFFIDQYKPLAYEGETSDVILKFPAEPDSVGEKSPST